MGGSSESAGKLSQSAAARLVSIVEQLWEKSDMMLTAVVRIDTICIEYARMGCLWESYLKRRRSTHRNST